MKYLSIISLALMLCGCAQHEERQADAMMSAIDSLYANGKYSEALDSIESLRLKYPKAVEARKKALKIWQEASLKMAQSDIAATDILLHETLDMLKTETDLYKANMLRMRRDSLQARYEAMCGVVKMIHMRQKEG